MKANLTAPSAGKTTGITETLDVIAFLESVGVSVIVHAKDGISLPDAMRVFADVRQPFEAAVEGIREIPAEFADLDPSEIAELAKAGVDLAFALFASVKG